MKTTILKKLVFFLTAVFFIIQICPFYNVTASTTINTDLNNDGYVDIIDLSLCASAYKSKYGDLTFIESYDVNKDNLINIFDLVIIARNFTNEQQSSKYYGIKPSNYTDDELKNIVIKNFNDYKNKFFRTVPNKENEMYIDYLAGERTNPSVNWVDKEIVTVSEAHGYGMIFIMNMAKLIPEESTEFKVLFDKFYNFFKSHPSINNKDLMCWKMMGVGYNSDGTGTLIDVVNCSDASSATDGDMDIAYSLLLADNLWGSNGTINYKEEALKIIKAIYESEVSSNENILLLGDWVKAFNSTEFYCVTRSSDFMLNYLKAFSEVDTENSENWMDVLETTEAIIEDNVSKWSNNTGLIGDFIKKEDGSYNPVKGEILEDYYDGDYNYNACRVPWRISINALYNNDQRLKDEIKIFNNWIISNTNGNPENIKPGYYVRSGEPGTAIPDRDYFDMSFLAPMSVAAALDKDTQSWLDSLFQYMTNTSMKYESYYGASLMLMAYFNITGNNFTIE